MNKAVSLDVIFQEMSISTPLLKFSKIGKPHFRYICLSEDKKRILWHSRKKNEENTEIYVEDMIKLVEGQTSDVFKKNKAYTRDLPNHLSFTIYYLTKEGVEKSLDLVCKDHEEYFTFVHGLKWLITHKNNSEDHEIKTTSFNSISFPSTKQVDRKLANVSLTELRDKMNKHADLFTWGSGTKFLLKPNRVRTEYLIAS